MHNKFTCNSLTIVIVTVIPGVGEWRHGLRSGEGEYIAADGTSYIGHWAYDKVMM